MPRTVSDWQKIKRLGIDVFLDWWPIRKLSEFVKLEWQGLKAGRALLIVIASICLLGGGSLGYKLGLYRASATVQAWHDEREWPPLNDAEISLWAKEFRQYPSPPEVVLHYEEPLNAKRFFRSLQAAGKQSGVKVTYLPGAS